MSRKTKPKKAAAPRSSLKCFVIYNGTSYPEEHGVKCTLTLGHDAGPPHGPQKHMGQSQVAGRPPLRWYTEDQKAARHEENEALRKELSGNAPEAPHGK